MTILALLKDGIADRFYPKPDLLEKDLVRRNAVEIKQDLGSLLIMVEQWCLSIDRDPFCALCSYGQKKKQQWRVKKDAGVIMNGRSVCASYLQPIVLANNCQHPPCVRSFLLCPRPSLWVNAIG
jgi:hypothetical protein